MLKRLQHFQFSVSNFAKPSYLTFRKYFHFRNKCRLEMAKIHANSEQYEEALAIYEDLAYSSLESRLVKYSADEYFFRAGLCHLAIDW